MVEEEEQYIVAGKAWQQEPRLGGHIVSTVRKQRQTEVHAQVASSFPLYIWSPTFGMGLLFSGKGLWKLPLGSTHPEVCLLDDIVERGLVIKMSYHLDSLNLSAPESEITR